jgi:CBS domain-containing protein
VTRHVLTDAAVLEGRVHELMSTPPIAVAPSEQVIDAFDLMNAKRIRRLPVVEGGRLVGIVTEGDLRRWVGQVPESEPACRAPLPATSVGAYALRGSAPDI